MPSPEKLCPKCGPKCGKKIPARSAQCVECQRAAQRPVHTPKSLFGIHPMVFQRRKAGWDMAKLAHEAGVSERSVVRMEHGHPVGLKTVVLCAAALIQRGGADGQQVGHAIEVMLLTQVNDLGRYKIVGRRA